MFNIHGCKCGHIVRFQPFCDIVDAPRLCARLLLCALNGRQSVQLVRVSAREVFFRLLLFRLRWFCRRRRLRRRSTRRFPRRRRLHTHTFCVWLVEAGDLARLGVALVRLWRHETEYLLQHLGIVCAELDGSAQVVVERGADDEAEPAARRVLLLHADRHDRLAELVCVLCLLSTVRAVVVLLAMMQHEHEHKQAIRKLTLFVEGTEVSWLFLWVSD